MSARSVVSAFTIAQCAHDTSPRNRRNQWAVHPFPRTLQVMPLDSAHALHSALEDGDELMFELKDHVVGNMTSPAKSHPAGWFHLNIGIPPGPIVLLNLVAILWGSQHAVIKMCVSDVDPSSLSLVRFCLGALLATPAWWYSSQTPTTSVKGNMSSNTVANELFTTWRWGTEMGLWMFLGYAFQSIGLAVSTATCLCTYNQAAGQTSLDTSTHFELPSIRRHNVQDSSYT